MTMHTCDEVLFHVSVCDVDHIHVLIHIGEQL